MQTKRRSKIDFAVRMLIQVYRNTLSHQLLCSCRFVPTCSGYALDAIDRYGAVSGGARILLRVLRCHPFSPPGFDPVR